MISKRCKSYNLLNHIKQKNIEHQVNFTFCKEKGDTNFLKWVGTLNINDREYVGVGKNHRAAIEGFMEQAEEYVYSLIKVKN